MSKGSNPRPYSVSQKKFADNFDKIFGEKKDNPDVDDLGRVAYKAHPETGEMIPDYMWAQMGMWKPKPKSHFIQTDSNIEYTSPITGALISGRRAQRYDLHSNGCRIYEGMATETTEAIRFQEHNDRRLDEKLEKSMAETLNDIRHQNNPPPETDKNGDAKMSWTFGL
ncbi:hypothetical protein OAA60_00640 [Porticoccaceae bacterium]|nr:hypothetical protein [Porticoccaceae bacterium]